jgi:hypothetical protein
MRYQQLHCGGIFSFGGVCKSHVHAEREKLSHADRTEELTNPMPKIPRIYTFIVVTSSLKINRRKARWGVDNYLPNA